MRKNYVIKRGRRSDEDIVPLFCPLCDHSLCTRNDITSYRKFQCCSTCQDLFCSGELAIQRWRSGYRPDKQTVKERYKMLGL